MNSVKVIDHGWERIMSEVALMDKSYTKVGFPLGVELGRASKKKVTQFAGKEKYSGISEVASVAMFHEFGTKQTVTPKQAGYLGAMGLHVKPGKTLVTPARPFMSTSFDEAQSDLNILRNKLYIAIVKGKTTTILALKIMGEFMTARTKKKIKEIKSPPLHPFTIANKKSSKPLIDTGQMINSVNHVEVLSRHGSIGKVTGRSFI